VGVALTDQKEVDDPIHVQLYASRIEKHGMQYEPLRLGNAGTVYKVPADSVLAHFSALIKAGDVTLGVVRVLDSLLVGPVHKASGSR
jgi:hypothetical protein